MKLTDIKEIKGRIILKSGLHIGAGDTEMHIGGTDNPVLKHPHTQEPYIPGSSLKGKVRSLLEMESGLMAATKGEPVQVKTLKGLTGEQEAKCRKILKIFGSSGADSGEMTDLGPTRVSFADCPMNATWKKKARDNRWDYFEVKSENSINRIEGTARNPRFTERVVEGAEFDFAVTLKLLDEKESDLFEYLLDGLKLLEMDALGGSGSRGYGRIAFQFEDENLNEKFKTRKPFSNGG
ncbi:MAG TPA: type III-A CRISPR-associated RAMP protein Csm3 [Smithella sp.]|jgi:CRISPR-associated protein Csm3|nr:type III-A CRISPR-associated RAMP protein Csm3 [Smithella sp.]HPX31668.1 type III-A CRISPR-associated RAMP protein Csm3 [Smithella sp.]HQC19901.1 type III-A CRISPR-associated RAMP protein Csm3 [Smithella sp.]